MSSTDPLTAPRPDETRSLVLVQSRGAVQRCRDFSRQALLDWRWLPTADEEQQAVAEDVLLMVSELVTNACLHAPGGPRLLRLSWNGERLRVTVSDGSARPPRLRSPAEPGNPGGHGLRVVDRLARSWGVELDTRGKAVWLEVAGPARTTEPGAAVDGSGWPQPRA
ncbi:ATP-binding protein [Streptomyces tateyamensis]|uniref:ATP-binding protein n=1 Tax=Streptomyces tateyamensis TaxID=565073 RepID=A0A2V4NUU9_9ACTN|nr:ATP-binding protein [Streptomyces tateyamensis]PYC69145.1 ATP-binding protein [Streptomyces tateyamensis]